MGGGWGGLSDSGILLSVFQYSWKLLNPTDPHKNKECPHEAEEYERVSDQQSETHELEIYILESSSPLYYYRDIDC